MMTRVLLVQLFVQLLLQWLPAAAKRRIGKDWSKISDDDWGRLDVSALFCGLLKRVARCRPLAALLCGPRPVMRVLTSAALLCRHTLGVCIHTYSARSASAAPPCRHELRLCVAMSCATVSPTVAPPCPQQLRHRVPNSCAPAHPFRHRSNGRLPRKPRSTRSGPQRWEPAVGSISPP